MFRGNVAVGLPADLIRNRPDIRQAERQLASATADIGVAEAALYPSLKFSGSVSISASTTSVASWSLAPILTLPVFDGGAGKARVNLAESEARSQYQAYKQTVLEAIEEVENGLVNVQREQRRRASLVASVESYKTALALIQERYSAGSASLQDVLDAQRSLYSAREAYAQSATALVSAYAALCKALGGGWQADPNNGSSS